MNQLHTTKYNKVGKKHMIPLVVIGIVVVMILALLWTQKSSCDRLSCIHVVGQEIWKEKDVYEHSKTSYRALFSRGDNFVRVQKTSSLTPEEAALLLKIHTMQIMGLFDDARSPYPGVLSDRIRCDERFKPQVATFDSAGLIVTYFHAGLNTRLQYGTCTDELPFVSYNASFYCERERALYQLEFIAKREDFDDHAFGDIATSIRCVPARN